MSEWFEQFQQMLYSDTPDYRKFCIDLKKAQEKLQDIELVHSQCLMRLSLALDALGRRGKGVSDACVLLRQLIRTYERRIMLPLALWNTLCTDKAAMGLRIADEREDGYVELVADVWMPSWLKNTQDMDRLILRRNDKHVVGDGLLYAMTKGKFASYQSLAQQVAVQACMFASSGSTLLITLPTGAGKSHCVLLPAWQTSRGGQIAGGTTLVVVPTISLALDLERRAKEYFTEAADSECVPACWTGGTSEDDRAVIVQGIRNGTLPILYVSPEALMKSQLHDVCLNAARQGTLNWLVVDEAHLIETWGSGFRTDFQFLAAYRKELLEASSTTLRTLLLSATISRSSATLLQRLFSENNNFDAIQANRLRPEPSYWFKKFQNVYAREQHVLEALRYLPRPAIVYVSTIYNANRWLQTLQQHDFQRVAMFTGETPNEERQRLVDAWDNNELDIMVATSAFGLGVDKSDVRTIIHACIPENVDRFYQEVGRAGRDGYNSISLLCMTLDDYGMAQSTLSDLITYEKGKNRWEGMRKTGIVSRQRGDIQLVDTSTPPIDRPDMRRGKSNKAWNEHTLLLMQRAGLLRIMDGREQEFRDIEARDSDAKAVSTWLQVQILAPSITGHPDGEAFQQLFTEAREKELLITHQAFYKMENIVKTYDDDDNNNKQVGIKHCLAEELLTLYPGCVRACGGCAYCRAHGMKAYQDELPLEVDLSTNTPASNYLRGDLRELMGWHETLNVVRDDSQNEASRRQLSHVLAGLVVMGIQQLLLPSELLNNQQWLNTFIVELAQHPEIPHLIRNIDDIVRQKQLPLYAIPTVIVYPADDAQADLYYRSLRENRSIWRTLHVLLVHVVSSSLYLESEHGRFIDRMDGNTYFISDLHTQLDRWQNSLW
ncbi:MAG TPA: protein DpdF [Ktedonobacteraceae bacterium]|nr:protein DpdF [Ktedonobacteraceae bacterium]